MTDRLHTVDEAAEGLAQQAGILCVDPVFQRFLFECGAINELNATMAAEAVRDACGVASRSEVIPGSLAAERWDELVGQFEHWKTV